VPFSRRKVAAVAQGGKVPEEARIPAKSCATRPETKLTEPATPHHQSPPIQNLDGHTLLASGGSSRSSAPPPPPQPQTLPPPPPPPPPPDGKSRPLAPSGHVLRSQPPSVVVGQRRRPAGFQRGRRRRVLPAPAARGEAESRAVAGVRRGARRRGQAGRRCGGGGEAEARAVAGYRRGAGRRGQAGQRRGGGDEAEALAVAGGRRGACRRGQAGRWCGGGRGEGARRQERFV
jgi:hypothetical protein